ncbi:amidohydrolase family protein [Collinsella tanakaei]|uniref:amidohydrolase family protein n=1 Tax=Collinsella tanakaei TaxID=626935 RepID=UPI001EF512C4|nr:amidohydrolase family protein [Collinsella tanakaei]
MAVTVERAQEVRYGRRGPEASYRYGDRQGSGRHTVHERADRGRLGASRRARQRGGGGRRHRGRAVRRARRGAYEAARVVDCEGRYLAPGLIDAHLHIESSNIRPAEYARMALACGTTTAIADCHEIANVCGLDGLRFMMADARRVPLDVKFMMPSCVPALPDEQAGACITADDMRAHRRRLPDGVGARRRARARGRGTRPQCVRGSWYHRRP